MIKNVFVEGRMHVLFLPNEEENDDDYNIFETLQAQAERIELLEEQNDALLSQEQILLELLETSSKTGKAITDSLSELKHFLGAAPENIEEMSRRVEQEFIRRDEEIDAQIEAEIRSKIEAAKKSESGKIE